MNTDTVSVRADVTVEVVLRYLRMRARSCRTRPTGCSWSIATIATWGTVALTRLLTDDRKSPWATSSTAQASRIAPETIAARRGAALPGSRPGVRRRRR